MPAIVPARIDELASRLGLRDGDVEPRGWHMGKLALGLSERLADRPVGRYVGVTAMSPTPFGEGKTVTAIALAMALERRGRRALATLREPSLGPLFGMKGGGAGGGLARLVPSDDINLHFTGDLHAVTAATNLLAALVDNHSMRGLTPRIQADEIVSRRAVDVCDRDLGRIVTGLNAPDASRRRETGFDLTPASEVMAILALARDLPDLRARLGRMVVAYTRDGHWVTADEIRAAGAMAALLRDAIRPNLVQTCEGTPALVHAGPFANIAHGNSSVIADQIALRLADYVVTESGFGADCGAEKLLHIKCRDSGLRPAAMVIVCTVRALHYHGGGGGGTSGVELARRLAVEDHDTLQRGAANLAAHIEIVHKFGLPAVVAINRFPADGPRELALVRQLAQDAGAADAAVVDGFARGGEGALELADAVERACATSVEPRWLYELDEPLDRKLAIVAREVYGAAELAPSSTAREQLERLQRDGFGRLPVCIAKTQYSLSSDPKLLGRPRGFPFPIDEVRLSAGAGFVYALSGSIRTMPGLPKEPAACRIDIDADGTICGLGP